MGYCSVSGTRTLDLLLTKFVNNVKQCDVGQNYLTLKIVVLSTKVSINFKVKNVCLFKEPYFAKTFLIDIRNMFLQFYDYV